MKILTKISKNWETFSSMMEAILNSNNSYRFLRSARFMERLILLWGERNSSKNVEKLSKVVMTNFMSRLSVWWSKRKRCSFNPNSMRFWPDSVSLKRNSKKPPCIMGKTRERACRLCKCNNKLRLPAVMITPSHLQNKIPLKLLKPNKKSKWKVWTKC